jgi:hypothetical protein
MFERTKRRVFCTQNEHLKALLIPCPDRSSALESRRLESSLS